MKKQVQRKKLSSSDAASRTGNPATAKRSPSRRSFLAASAEAGAEVTVLAEISGRTNEKAVSV